MGSTHEDHRFEDPEQFCQAFQAAGWAAEYDQISRGPFRGRLSSTQVGASQIHHGRWARGIRHTGCQPEGMVALGLTLGQRGTGHLLGQTFETGDVIVIENREGFEIYSAPIWELAIFLIPAHEFTAQVAALAGHDPGTLGRNRSIAKPPPAQRARLIAASRTFFQQLEQSAHKPEPRDERLALETHSRRIEAMGEELLNLAIQQVANAETRPMPAPAHQRRLDLVASSVEYATLCKDDQLRIPELCRHLGVSERTLRYAFKDVTGRSPASLIHTHRLNRVRRDLLEADPSETLVKTVAYSHGFWHAGQFYKDYYRLFGERPSETLADSIHTEPLSAAS